MGTYRDELLATATALLAATATEAVRTGMTPSVHLEWAVDKAQALIKAVDKRAGEQVPVCMTVREQVRAANPHLTDERFNELWKTFQECESSAKVATAAGIIDRASRGGV